MPDLIRRRDKESRFESWSIFYGDVRVGHVGIRAGVPNSAPQWGWACSFYPGMVPGTGRTGIASTFEEARTSFEAAWKAILPTLTESQFEEYRRASAAHAEIRAIRARGEKLPSEIPSSVMRCVCGVEFDSHNPEESFEHRAHIYAAQRADEIER